MRPNLTKDINVELFKDFYWLKEELQSFCKQHGLSASGSKLEISSRIEAYLRTGEILKPARTPSRKSEPQTALSHNTIITENHRCSQHVRAFFQSVIPNFHFSTYIQNYFKENVGKTYADAIEAWYKEEERKKDPKYKKTIAPHSNTINLYVTFMPIQRIMDKVVKRRLKLGIK